MTTTTRRRTLADAVRRPPPAAVIAGVSDGASTDLVTPPVLTPEAFDPVAALATLEGWQEAIAQSTDPHELRSMAATTSAIQGWLAHQRESTAVANAASATTLAAERRLGSVLADMERAPGQRDGAPSEYRTMLEELDLNRSLAARWIRLAAIPDRVFQAYIKNAVDGRMTTGHITEAGLKRFAEERKPGTTAAPTRPSAEALCEAARLALGEIDCDASQTPVESWSGRVWLSPKAAHLTEWITACVQAWTDERVRAAVLHVPVQPDADWWALLAGNPLCILRQLDTPDQGRLGGRDRTAGAVIGLGVSLDDLGRAFSDLGWTYQGATT